jgi:hypothetical protein
MVAAEELVVSVGGLKVPLLHCDARFMLHNREIVCFPSWISKSREIHWCSVNCVVVEELDSF